MPHSAMRSGKTKPFVVISNPVEEPKYRLWPLRYSGHKRYLDFTAIEPDLL
jgi:hypothetical protein